MKKYVVEFIVQTDDKCSVFDALRQAEMYLNTCDRCVDCNVRLLTPEECENNNSFIDTERTLPATAEFLGDEGY